MIKYFRILKKKNKKKTHAYLQTILKASVKFQKGRLKTVVGVTGTRYLLPIRFCSIRTQKMSKLKNAEKVIKNYFRILKKKKHMHILEAILKAHVKFQKDRPKTVEGVKGTMYLFPIHFYNIRTQKMSKLKMRKSDKKIFQESEKKQQKNMCISSGHPKSPCKVSKGSAKNCGRS